MHRERERERERESERESEREREREKRGRVRKKKAIYLLSFLLWNFYPSFSLVTSIRPKTLNKRQKKKEHLWKLQ